MVPRLVAIAGPRKGEVFPLTGEDLSIGRDASNGLRIRDRSVSRLHCVLSFEGGQYRIRDLESRNGVFVNDIPVREKELDDGDQIKIGSKKAKRKKIFIGRRQTSDLYFRFYLFTFPF